MIELAGIYAPATTPFDAVTGDADVVAMRANVRAWLEHPLAGVVLFGSTGEGLLVDDDERARVLDGVRDVVDDGRALLAGVAAESTRAAVRLAHLSADHGADAVLVQPPAYYRPALTAEALRDHFRAVADASPVPVVLYQVPPQFSGIELAAGLVGELAQHPNIAGIKDSTGDLRTLGAYVDACGGRCAVLVGSGAAAFGALETGAVGGILAVSLLAPAEAAALYARWRAGDGAAAGRLQERIGPVHRAVVAQRGVAGIKAGLDMLGLTGGAPRPPLRPLRERDRAEVRAALESAGLLVGDPR
jgi:4-hydroxy-2-oxoglutarate aldolase